MKKIILIIGIFLTLSSNIKAEVYYGIDIDQVYNSSDWSSKDKIKDVINDYTLLQQYEQKLFQCSQSLNKLDCLNALAEDIIKHFYSHDIENSLKEYHDYVKSVSAVYSIVYCLNKYRLPSGTICNQETLGKTRDIIEQYNRNLLQSAKQILNGYSFLKDYKN